MTSDSPDAERHAQVKDYYRQAAESHGPDLCRSPSPDGAEHRADERWGVSRYDPDTLSEGPEGAVSISMGCGNPFAVADLRPGERVLDLGSGGGLDVILSAKRVGPTGMAFGVDFLPEMVELAQANAQQAGVSNVEFREGTIEDLPLADDSVDVVISNCVINLAPDKVPVFAELSRVLRPGGRVAVSDVVAKNGLEPSGDGREWASCGAGALQHDEYLALLAAAGLQNASIEYTHETGPGLRGAIIRAISPDE